MLRRALFSLLLLAGSAFAQVDGPQPFGIEKARTFPFSMVGQLLFTQGGEYYLGSGTVIRPRSILTAAHNLWDADRGFSTDLLFRRSFYTDNSLDDHTPSRVYVLAGYREKARNYEANDARAFAEDLGGLLFDQPVARGGYAGWWANPKALLGTLPLIAQGYGAQTHTGNELLSVSPKSGFTPITGAFFENSSAFFEGGMSGGPVFALQPEGALSITGIVVAGAVNGQAGGIRALDEAAGTFIRTYLK